FVFSSRRRHTRSKRDWSSDVCSSDLVFSLRRGSNRGWKYSNTPNTSQAGVNRIVLAMWSLNLCFPRQPQLRLLQPPCSWPVTPRTKLIAAQNQTNPSKSPPDWNPNRPPVVHPCDACRSLPTGEIEHFIVR